MAMRFGVHGGIAGGSNLAPRFYVELYRAAPAGAAEKVERMQSALMEISARIYHAVTGESGSLRGMKAALSCIGHCRNVLAEPYEPFGTDLMSVTGADGFHAPPLLKPEFSELALPLRWRRIT